MEEGASGNDLSEHAVENIRKALVVAQFDPDLWSLMAQLMGRTDGDENGSPSDPYLINSVVYSNYRPDKIYDFAVATEHWLSNSFSRRKLALDEWSSVEQLDAVGEREMCSLIRLSRLYEAQCPGDRWYCFYGGLPNHRVKSMDKAAEFDMCKAERKAPLAALAYEPQDVGLMSSPIK
jgi:hypothetical protein